MLQHQNAAIFFNTPILSQAIVRKLKSSPPITQLQEHNDHDYISTAIASYNDLHGYRPLWWDGIGELLAPLYRILRLSTVKGLSILIKDGKVIPKRSKWSPRVQKL